MHIPLPVISIISFITPSVNSEGAPRATSRDRLFVLSVEY